MDINNIAIAIIFGIVIGAFAYKAGTLISNAKKTPSLEDDEEAKKTVLNDFLNLLSSIALSAIEIVGKKEDLSDEEYKKYLAQEIVNQFDANIVPHFEGTLTGKIFGLLSNDEKVNFVLENVLTKSSIMEKINNILNDAKDKIEDHIDNLQDESKIEDHPEVVNALAEASVVADNDVVHLTVDKKDDKKLDILNKYEEK